MLDNRKCVVGSAADLDKEIRDILALETMGEGDQICGTLNVYYPNESVKEATLLPLLEERGVAVKWHKKA